MAKKIEFEDKPVPAIAIGETVEPVEDDDNGSK